MLIILQSLNLNVTGKGFNRLTIYSGEDDIPYDSGVVQVFINST